MEIGLTAPASPRRIGAGSDGRLESAAEVIANQIEVVELADDVGFARIGFIEHHFVSGIVSTAPLISVAAMAQRTKNVRLSTDVILSPYHHPLMLAEQIGLTDILTKGRLEVGFARGSSPYEASRVGINSVIEASERQMECLEVLLGVWGTEDEFSYDGRFYNIPPVTALPRPIQKPHPPMWVAARSADTMRFCIEHGLGVHTTAILEPMSNVYDQLKLLDALVAEVGAPGRPPLGALRGVFISEDPKEIRQWLERTAAAQNAGRMAGFADSTAREQARKKAQQLQGVVAGTVPEPANANPADEVTPEMLAERLIVGTPDVVIARLREYEAIGFDEFGAGISGTQEQTLRAVHLFGKYVIPEFRDHPKAPSVRTLQYSALAGASAGARRDTEREAIVARSYGLGPTWRDWTTEQWVEHVDRDPQRLYVFDFAVAPKVRGDVTGFIDLDGKLQRIVGEACPVCDRPVVAIVRRRAADRAETVRGEIKRALRESGWHESNPAHVSVSGANVGSRRG